MAAGDQRRTAFQGANNRESPQKLQLRCVWKGQRDQGLQKSVKERCSGSSKNLYL